MPPVSKTTRKKKKKVGRPAFSRKDIPERFFRYYDAYRFGFWNKREFAEHLCVSRPTLDRYFETIGAKPPLVSKAEHKRLKKLYNVSDDLRDLIEFYKILKGQHGEKVKSTGLYGNAAQMRFYFRLRALQRKEGELTLASVYEALGSSQTTKTDDSES